MAAFELKSVQIVVKEAVMICPDKVKIFTSEVTGDGKADTLNLDLQRGRRSMVIFILDPTAKQKQSLYRLLATRHNNVMSLRSQVPH